MINLKLKGGKMKEKYPEEAIELLEKTFPKGNKKRGEVMTIMALAFIEGKKISEAQRSYWENRYKKLEEKKLIKLSKENLK